MISCPGSIRVDTDIANLFDIAGILFPAHIVPPPLILNENGAGPVSDNPKRTPDSPCSPICPAASALKNGIYQTGAFISD